MHKNVAFEIIINTILFKVLNAHISDTDYYDDTDVLLN